MLGLSWMAGGSTRAAFNVNFSARRGNIADITAKATSQTIAASLLGATCGVAPFDATCTRQRATNTHRRRKQRQGDSGAAERVYHCLAIAAGTGLGITICAEVGQNASGAFSAYALLAAVHVYAAFR
jgi:hypothetical protein